MGASEDSTDNQRKSKVAFRAGVICVIASLAAVFLAMMFLTG